MSADGPKQIELEIAHVLFIDIVGYSKQLVSEQRLQLETLNEIVRSTNEFQTADKAGRLIKLPTGDGMALVFSKSPEAPVQCAVQLLQALKHHPDLRVRMGVHSGPVSGVVDLNNQSNVAGAGINMAQRVMDCGDAGHLLVSRHVAEDLEHYEEWRSALHDLGECEVKHGVRIALSNLYRENFGNPALPQKLKAAQRSEAARLRSSRSRIYAVAALLLILILAGGYFLARRHDSGSIAQTAITAKSVAVLPFENLSANQENAYFAEGVQDEILTCLAKIADLKVISRTSVMQYKTGIARNLREIGTQLGVAHVLEGSVQRIAGKVRVTAQLIDARTDAHLWAEHYDRPLDDVFAIQSEIAKTIADQLQARLSPSEQAAISKPPTKNLAAYDLYLRAIPFYDNMSNQVRARDSLPKAVELLTQAVTADPDFVLAWCLLSNVHGAIYLSGLDHTPARLALANAAVQSALRIQPDSGEGHLALGSYYYRGFRDYQRARVELAGAQRTMPNSAEVAFLTGVIGYRDGKWEEATRALERSIDLDPRNVLAIQQLALCYQPQRRYTDEARMWEKALTILPGDPTSRINRAIVDSNWKADIKPFQRTFDELVAENPAFGPDIEDPFQALRERTPAAAARMLKNYPGAGVVYYGVNYPHSYWEAVVARWQGDANQARAAFTAARAEVATILQSQPDSAAALSLLGLIDAGLGRKEEAVREGRQACELLPMTKDAVDGVAFAVNLAQIYTWVGEKELAIDQLVPPLKVPNDLHYGELKLHPLWDPLRGHPRFEQLLATQAPK